MVHSYNFYVNHSFLIIGHPSSQHPTGCTLRHRILLMLFFFTCGQTRWYFHFWIYAEDIEWILKAVHDILNTIYISFRFFFWFFGYFLVRLPYLEVIPGIWKYHPTSSPTMSTISQFSLNFLPFLVKKHARIHNSILVRCSFLCANIRFFIQIFSIAGIL